MAEKEIVNKKGFTLAETMVVLIVLGIVASITIPPLVRRQIEAANRAKIKKSMTVYDYVMNQMTAERNIKSTPEMQAFAPIGDCTNTAPYFKAVENDNGNICRFKTSDGVWWDISDILNPTIALNEDDLDNPDSATTFNLKAWFDDIGLRVDDLNAVSDENKLALQKLYDYINGKKSSSETTEPTNQVEECTSSYCKFLRGDYSEECDRSSSERISCNGGATMFNYNINGGTYMLQTTFNSFYYDDDGRAIGGKVANRVTGILDDNTYVLFDAGSSNNWGYMRYNCDENYSNCTSCVVLNGAKSSCTKDSSGYYLEQTDDN